MRGVKESGPGEGDELGIVACDSRLKEERDGRNHYVPYFKYDFNF